jgi:hypothetical protein
MFAIDSESTMHARCAKPADTVHVPYMSPSRVLLDTLHDHLEDPLLVRLQPNHEDSVPLPLFTLFDN